MATLYLIKDHLYLYLYENRLSGILALSHFIDTFRETVADIRTR
jgi:hypothetical protein